MNSSNDEGMVEKAKVSIIEHIKIFDLDTGEELLNRREKQIGVNEDGKTRN